MKQEAPLKISVILPAYQKKEVIQQVLQNLFSLCNDNFMTEFECILIIDGGQDNTAALARELNLERLKIIEYPENKGKGHAISTGIKASSGEIIAYIDADLDLEVSAILEGYKLFLQDQTLQAVVGSKWIRGRSSSYPMVRRLGSLLFKALVRVFFKISVSDSQTGLKMFRKTNIKHLVASRSLNERFLWDLEVLYHYSKQKWRVGEIPVELNYQSESSIRIKDVILSFSGVLYLRIKYWRRRFL